MSGREYNRICNIEKVRDTGDFRINYSFGVTRLIRAGTEDWEDIHLFLQWHSPGGIYEREEIRQ